MSDLVFSTIICSVVVGASAAVLGLIEQIGTDLFARWAFRLGIRVFRRVGPLPVPSVSAPITLRSATTKYRFASPTVCLCREHALSVRLGNSTIKCTVLWRDDEAEIVGRVPLFPCIFQLAWLTMWTAGALGFGQHEPLLALGALLLGWCVVGGTQWASTVVEIRRGRAMFDELASLLSSDGISMEHRADPNRSENGASLFSSRRNGTKRWGSQSKQMGRSD